MSVDEPGRVSYTVKELLARMEGKIDGSNDRLGRIEQALANAATASALAAVSARVAVLELEVVRREGPIVREIRGFEKKVDGIAAMALTKEAIAEALKAEAERIVELTRSNNASDVTRTQARLAFVAIAVSIVLSIVGILAAHPAILFAFIAL